MPFPFVDLFAGIGGFHAALAEFGGELQMAVEIDPLARETYKRNWGSLPERDVVDVASNRLDAVGEHAVLAGGFPCQPFSKSGHQLGMGEQRGQLFDEILKILVRYKPPMVVLENVRNITGPRQTETWEHIVRGLRTAGYRVPSEPCIISPHRLRPEDGGAPQSRERVYILGTYVGRERALKETEIDPVLPKGLNAEWSKSAWSLDSILDSSLDSDKYGFSVQESNWIRVWNDFLTRVGTARLPGHPLWSDYWSADARIDSGAPRWKQKFEEQNLDFYESNQTAIDAWKRANPGLQAFPASRRKLEWQAQSGERDLLKHLLHLRPSGIRVKRMTYTPALVAMAQTPLIGPLKRRMTPRETARLQGFPESFELDHQSDAVSYKQLGNAINVGVAQYVVRAHVQRDASELARTDLGRLVVDEVLRDTESTAASL